MTGYNQIEVKSSFMNDSIASQNRGKAINISDMYSLKTKKAIVGDTKVHDANFAFLSTTLAKLHKTLHEPKWYVTWDKDIKANMGGGFVDYVEWYTVNWAGILDNNRNLVGNSANYIPRVNAAMTQNLAKVFTYEVAYDLRFVDLEKMKKLTLQKSIQDIYNDVITAGWDLFVQDIAYVGAADVKGLFNNDSKVLVNTIDNHETIGTCFEGMADDAVVACINGIIATYLKESNNNINLIPNRILIPMNMMSDLVGRYSALYSNTLYDFILEHNLGIAQSGKAVKLVIEGRSALDTLGTAGKGRIVAYRDDEDFVRIDIPYQMQHYITLPNIERMAYTSAFLGQVSQVQMPYNTDNASLGIVTYWDFTD